MKSGIYRITCLSNGKCYIGSSCDISRRWREHKYALDNNRHDNKYLQSAWNKYGEDSFVFSIILLCPVSVLIQKEQEQFDATRRALCFNLSFIAGKVEMTSEIRRKMSESRKGVRCSEETKRKISESQKGKRLSDETKIKISESARGRRLSKETKIKISESGRGSRNRLAKLTEEQVLAIRSDPRRNPEIALKYEVSPKTISKIKCRASWKHI